MTDPVERDLRKLLDERANTDPLALERLADGIAAFPGRPRFGSSALVGIVAVALLVIAAAAAPRLAGIAAGPSPTLAPTATASPAPTGPVLPGGPEAFAGDPRMRQCYASPSTAQYVFVIDHARDYRLYLPRMGMAPELDVDASAFVVVFAQDTPQFPTTGIGPDPTNEPGHRYVCVLVDGQDGNLYADVDITGLTIDVTSSTSPSPTGVAVTRNPTPTPTPPLSPDGSAALDLATRYETARSGGDFVTAWAMLSDQAQALAGSESAFAATEAAYNAAGGTVFSIQAPTQDPDLEANFLGGMAAQIASVADTSRGFLVFVQHPDVKAASAGTSGLFVAPLTTGEWRIWIVH